MQMIIYSRKMVLIAFDELPIWGVSWQWKMKEVVVAAAADHWLLPHKRVLEALMVVVVAGAEGFQ